MKGSILILQCPETGYENRNIYSDILPSKIKEYVDKALKGEISYIAVYGDDPNSSATFIPAEVLKRSVIIVRSLED